jgi:hypothetical protein
MSVIYETQPHCTPTAGQSASGYKPPYLGCILASNLADKMRTATSLVALLCSVALADSCAESSGSHSYWRIDGLVLKVYNWDNGGTTGTFGFKSYYSGTNKTVECSAKDVDLAKLEDTWSPCNSSGSEFQFHFADLSLSLKETWLCSRYVTYSPISVLSREPMLIFPSLGSASLSANATGNMMLHGCLNTNTETGIESNCTVMEFEMAANVTLGSPAALPGHHH